MFCPKCGSQNPDGALFCTTCGEKFAQAAQEAVTEAVTQAAAPVAEQVQEAVENAAPVAPAPQPAPVQPVAPQPAPQPVQQPVYQQPVYQQPVYQQPVYQQPVYQQPVFQQPAPEKKKSKAPLIITLIIVILVLAAGGLIAYETFLAKEEDRPEWLAALDFKKDGSSLPLTDKEQSTFKKLVKVLDEAIIDKDGDAYADGIPSYARSFVWSVYGEDSAKSFVTYLNEDEDNGVALCGDDIKVTEEIVSAKKVKADDLAEAFEDVFGKEVEIEAAYLVTNNSCFKGSDDSAKYYDYYIFFKEDDEWQVILIGEDNLKKFGLK